jgi:hypothetical protein
MMAPITSWWVRLGPGKFYQTVSAAPGIEYTLTVLGGADAWWLPKGTMSMFFLDGSGAVVGTATTNTVDPAVYGPNYDIPHPWASYSLTTNAPSGTTQLRVEFASNNGPGVGGSIWFENADLNSVAYPPLATFIRRDDPDAGHEHAEFHGHLRRCNHKHTGRVERNDISSNLGWLFNQQSCYLQRLKVARLMWDHHRQDANNLSASVPLTDTFNPVFLWKVRISTTPPSMTRYLPGPTAEYFGVVGTILTERRWPRPDGDFMSTGWTRRGRTSSPPSSPIRISKTIASAILTVANGSITRAVFRRASTTFTPGWPATPATPQSP